jgi:succinyl-CoA synthetase beta subunit
MYVSFVQDRDSETGVSCLISTYGGSDIEEKGTKALV